MSKETCEVVDDLNELINSAIKEEVGDDNDVETKHTDMGTLDWLYLLLTVNIPIIGWLVVLFGALSNKKKERKKFCRAYLLFKVIILAITIIILLIMFNVAIDILDEILKKVA